MPSAWCAPPPWQEATWEPVRSRLVTLPSIHCLIAFIILACLAHPAASPPTAHTRLSPPFGGCGTSCSRCCIPPCCTRCGLRACVPHAVRPLHCTSMPSAQLLHATGPARHAQGSLLLVCRIAQATLLRLHDTTHASHPLPVHTVALPAHTVALAAPRRPAERRACCPPPNPRPNLLPPPQTTCPTCTL